MDAHICDICGKIVNVNQIGQPNMGVREKGLQCCPTCLGKIQDFVAELQRELRPTEVTVPYEACFEYTTVEEDKAEEARLAAEKLAELQRMKEEFGSTEPAE